MDAMLTPDWKYTETIQKRLRFIKINKRERHLDAQDIDEGISFCLDAEVGLDLCRVKLAKVYRVTIQVFTAELSGELERHLTEMSMENAQLRHSLQVIKRTGSNLKKFVLVDVK
jgi:hypothetical protein